MLGEDLPSDFFKQGKAMAAAAVTDLLSGGFDVVLMSDERSPLAVGDVVEIVTVAFGDNLEEVLEEQGHEVDGVLIISPECEGRLAERIMLFERLGVKLLNVGSDIAELCGDKFALNTYLNEQAVNATENFLLETDWQIDGKVICKLRDGAGCEGMRIFKNEQELQNMMASVVGQWVVESYLENALNMSVCIVVDGGGDCYAMPPHTQNVQLNNDGNLNYFGGRFDQGVDPKLARRAETLAISAVQAIQKIGKVLGVVGVDLLIFEDEYEDRVVEINPRLTLSFAGMSGAYQGSVFGMAIMGQKCISFHGTGTCYDVSGKMIKEQGHG